MASPFKQSQLISLQIPELSPGKWFSTHVLSFVDKRELEIAVPREDGHEVVVPPEYKVLLELVLPDGLRRMSAYVKSRTASKPPGLLLDWPETDERIQRRDNVRVSVMFQVFVRPEVGPGKYGTRINGTVVDVSAGGARVLVPEPLWEGLNVELALQIPGIGERMCAGKVIRSLESTNATSAYQFSIGVQFNEISEAVKRDITKFVFDTQLEHFRKGAV